jgi:methionine-rich copper-binding protein CopC
MAQSVQSRWLAGIALAVAVLIGLVAWVQFGFAHASYERSEPADGEVVSESPAQVVIYFSQEIAADGTVLRVVNSDGTQVDLGDTTLDLFDPDRKRVTVSLPPDLPAGTYTVEWTTASSEDGETDSGRFSFTVAGGDSTEASPMASPAASPEATPATPVAGTPASGG